MNKFMRIAARILLSESVVTKSEKNNQIIHHGIGLEIEIVM